jgi:hypothetical protein
VCNKQNGGISPGNHSFNQLSVNYNFRQILNFTCVSSDLSIEKKYRQHLFISEMDDSENYLLTLESEIKKEAWYNQAQQVKVCYWCSLTGLREFRFGLPMFLR